MDARFGSARKGARILGVEWRAHLRICYRPYLASSSGRRLGKAAAGPFVGSGLSATRQALFGGGIHESEHGPLTAWGMRGCPIRVIPVSPLLLTSGLRNRTPPWGPSLPSAFSDSHVVQLSRRGFVCHATVDRKRELFDRRISGVFQWELARAVPLHCVESGCTQPRPRI